MGGPGSGPRKGSGRSFQDLANAQKAKKANKVLSKAKVIRAKKTFGRQPKLKYKYDTRG